MLIKGTCWLTLFHLETVVVVTSILTTTSLGRATQTATLVDLHRGPKKTKPRNFGSDFVKS